MRTIRIGNDIRLKITLDCIDDYTNVNIKSVKCYLTRIGGDVDTPHNEFPQYVPDHYNINMCGFPSYHTDPINGCLCDWRYRGYGIFPKSKSNTHRHYDFLMPSKILNDKNIVECYFPAEEQRYCGTYKLTVVFVIYQHAWGPANLRTITMDYGRIFELVDDATGESGDFTIVVDNSGTNDYSTITFKSGYDEKEQKVVVLRYSDFVLPKYMFTAPDKYEFSKWNVNGKDITGIYNPSDIIKVNSDIVVTALYHETISSIVDKIEILDRDLDKLRLPDGEEFVKIINNN